MSLFKKKLVLQAVYKNDVFKVFRQYRYDYKYLPVNTYTVTKQQKMLEKSECGIEQLITITTTDLFVMFLSKYITELLDIFQLEFEYIHPFFRLKMIEIFKELIHKDKLKTSEIYRLENWLDILQINEDTLLKSSFIDDLDFPKILTNYNYN